MPELFRMRFEIGEQVAFVQPVTGFVALKPQAARFPIEAFGKDVNFGHCFHSLDF